MKDNTILHIGTELELSISPQGPGNLPKRQSMLHTFTLWQIPGSLGWGKIDDSGSVTMCEIVLSFICDRQRQRTLK